MSAVVSVALVDDHEPYRRALCRLLNGSGRFEVAFEVGSAEDVLHWLGTEVVDVVLCDLHLPGMNGDDLCRAMRSGGITTPVCLLSADARRSTLVAALGSGAGGFVHKSAETGELLDVLDRVACGREALDSLSAVQLVGGPRRGGATSLDAAQVAWLSGLADGVAAIELAGRAGVRVRDLNALRDRTLSQLAAPHEAAAVGWALRNKIIE